MRYDYQSLKNINSEDIITLINSINTLFNENLQITTTAKTEAWNRRKNVEVLCDWLNNRNAHRFIKNDLPNAEEIDGFIMHEQQIKREFEIKEAVDKAKNALNEAIQLIKQ